MYMAKIDAVFEHSTHGDNRFVTWATKVLNKQDHKMEVGYVSGKKLKGSTKTIKVGKIRIGGRGNKPFVPNKTNMKASTWKGLSWNAGYGSTKDRIECFETNDTNLDRPYIFPSNFTKTEEYKAGDGKVYWNKGDTAEGIWGAAFVARFKKDKPDSDVTINDVKDVIAQLQGQGFKTRYQVSGWREHATKGPGAFYREMGAWTVNDFFLSPNDPKQTQDADPIFFICALAEQNMRALQDPWAQDQLVKIFNNAIDYVNSHNVKSWDRLFYENGRIDNIVVVADGLSDQKGSKIDISVFATNDTGKLVTMNMDISLKAGASQFGQISGFPFETQVEYWSRVGVNVDTGQNKESYNKFINVKPGVHRGGKDAWQAHHVTFKAAADYINNHGDEDTFKREFGEGIEWHGQRKDPDVLMIHSAEAKGVHTYELNRITDVINALPKLGAILYETQPRDGTRRKLKGIHIVSLPDTSAPPTWFRDTTAWTELKPHVLVTLRVLGNNKPDGTKYLRNIVELQPGLATLIEEDIRTGHRGVTGSVL